MVIVLSLLAALLFAVGTVLQQRVASKSSSKDAAKASFLLQLARKPQWLAGIAADGLGFAAQAVALGMGRLVVVQPLMATSVVFALPFSAFLEHKRVSRRELAGAIAVAVGLAAFLLAGDPAGGREDATPQAWAVAGAGIGLLAGGLVLAARGRSPEARAAMLGIATGLLFGITAGLTKALAEMADEGAGAVLSDWHLYALLVTGYLAMAVNQAALQTGALAAAVATQTALNPMTSIMLGVFAFDEKLHHSAFGVIGVLLSLALMVGGVIFLAAAEQRESAGEAPPGSR